MKIAPDETELVGKWTLENERVHADSTCERIQWLVANHLRKVAFSSGSGAWETLFRDCDDGRYWEQTYPQSEMHGGGPPKLKWLSREDAERKYGRFE